MNTLELRLVAPGPESRVQLRPVVDGRDILAEVFDPQPANDPRYVPLRATDEAREVQLAEAECTEGCCGAVYVTIRRVGDEVVWDGWRNPDEETVDLTELRFDAEQYHAEIDRVMSDHSWEWPARAVMRLLDAELSGHPDWPARWDCAFRGVSSWQPNQVVVFVTYPAGVRRGDDDPWLDFLISLPVTDDDPAEQAKALAGLVLASDPREFGEARGGSPAFARELGYPWHGG